MITLKQNPNSQQIGIDIADQQSGCCGTTLAPCKYVHTIASTPTTITSVLINGVTYTMNHTYVDAITLQKAFVDLFTKPVTEGGLGASVEPNDVKVYLDAYAVTPNTLTIEFISGLVVTNIISNVGTHASATPVCASETRCEYETIYTLSAAITVNINGNELTLTTYATAALLRTALIAQISAAGLTGIVYVKVRTGVSGTAKVVFHAVPNTKIYHDGDLLAQGKCVKQYV